MLVSFNWLKKYASLPEAATPEGVGDRLKLSTVEVEKIEKMGGNLEKIVVGKVLKTERHPGADRLKVCEVDIGKEKVKVVCGGSNVYEGELVALALVGAKIRWHGHGDLVELALTTIRGVESRGMICSASELGLEQMFPLKEEKEILDISFLAASSSSSLGREKDSLSPLTKGRIKVGSPLLEALGLDDSILEIDNKSLSNRPDLWGHYGLAREVAVLYQRELAGYKTKAIKEGKEMRIKVNIANPKLCQRYLAMAIGGVKVAESPDWLKRSLLAVGLRPINNIVDVTNYIMYDLGQPMHAFDAAKIFTERHGSFSGPAQQIGVRPARDGEKFIALDERELKLSSADLVIANNGDKVIALAGVIGGVESGINESTSMVVLESANFDAASVRKTSIKFGLRTDSSARFEKSLDPYLCDQALEKAVEMILEICPEAKVKSNVVDEKHIRIYQGPLEVPWESFTQRMGVEIPVKDIIGILNRLGFAVEKEKNILRVKIPTWRATRDISLPEDLVEETARIYGYEKIPAILPQFPIAPPLPNRQRVLERSLKEILINSLAYSEVYNYSFVSQTAIEKMGDKLKKYIELANPLSKEKPFLRRHLLTNLLENIKKNLEFYPELRLLEIGKVFLSEEPGQRAKANSNELLPRQDTYLTAVYVNKKDKNPFNESRRALETILNFFGYEFSLRLPDRVEPWQQEARAGVIKIEESDVGRLYEINPLTAEKFGLDARLGVLELNLSLLAEKKTPVKKFKRVSLFPAAVRDLALAVDKNMTHAEIVSFIKSGDALLEAVELFDIFEGENLGKQRKSLAYHLIFRHPERTLTAAEVDEAMKKIVELLVEKLGAEVRE